MNVRFTPPARRFGPVLSVCLPVGIAYLAVTYAFDWWQLQASLPPARLLALRVAGAIAAGLFVVGAVWMLRAAAPRTRRVFAAWLAALGLWLVVCWPGFVMSDSYIAYLYSLAFPIKAWLGFFTPVLFAMTMQLVPSFAAVAGLQILAAACLLAYTDAVLHREGAGRTMRWLFHASFALSVPFLFNVLLLSRDVGFSFAAMALAVGVFDLGRRPPVDAFDLRVVVMGAVAAIAVLFRIDGWFVVAAAVGATILVTHRSVGGLRSACSRFAVAGVLFALLVAGYGTLLAAAIGRDSERWDYIMSLVMNPLGYVVQRVEAHHPDRIALLADIDKATDVERLIAESVPDENPTFWTGATRHRAEREEKVRFLKRTAELFVSYPLVFLEGRLQTFLGASGMGPRLWATYVDTAGEWDKRTDWYKDARPIPERLPLPELRRTVVEALRWSAKTGTDLNKSRSDPTGTLTTPRSWVAPSVFFWNFLPELAVLLVAVVGWRRSPLTAAAAGVVLSRLPLVFLIAPASQFKYYLSIEMAAAFVVCASVLERRARHAT